MSLLSVLASCEIITSFLSLIPSLLKLKYNCKLFCLGGVVLLKTPGFSCLLLGPVLSGCMFISLLCSSSDLDLGIACDKICSPFQAAVELPPVGEFLDCDEDLGSRTWLCSGFLTSPMES